VYVALAIFGLNAKINKTTRRTNLRLEFNSGNRLLIPRAPEYPYTPQYRLLAGFKKTDHKTQFSTGG